MSKSFWMAGVALAVLSATALRADDAADGPELKAGPVRFEVRAEPTQVGGFWLGVGCQPARGPLNAQLGLPEDQGLVVEDVVPESPAAKAGIQRYDVLVKASDKPLKQVADLIEAIGATKGEELMIELIRGGKSRQIKATPAKRPEEARAEQPVAPPADEALRKALQYLERLQPGTAGKGPWRYRIFRPGTILPPGAAVHPPLPGNMSVTISKQGDKPARIVVSRDDKKWEVTEKDLQKLPGDVRPHVERMLGRMTFDAADRTKRLDVMPEWDFFITPGPMDARPEVPRPFPETSPKGTVEKRMEKRMDEMNRRIDQLRKLIEDLRENRPRRRAPEEDPDRS